MNHVSKQVTTTMRSFLALILIIASFASYGQSVPAITYVSPANGAEVRPLATVVVTVTIASGKPIKTAALHWRKTGNDLRCPGKGKDWRCTTSGKTYKWEVDLGKAEGVRRYYVKATDTGGKQTVAPDRELRVVANPTGTAVALIAPISPLKLGENFEFVAEAATTGPTVQSVSMRLADNPLGFPMTQVAGNATRWRLPSVVAKQPSSSEIVIYLDATTASGTSTAGPYRIRFDTPVAAGGLPVLRYQTTTPVLTNGRADDVLARFQELLATDDDGGGYDLECVLQPPAGRNGDVRTFTFGDGSLDTAAELRQVLDQAGGGIYVVNEINYCGGEAAPSTIGCAGPNGAMAVERLDTIAEEGVLWAHEFGHVAGLSHVLKADHPLNLMNKGLRTDKTRVRSWQCDNLQEQASDDWGTQVRRASLAGEPQEGDIDDDELPSLDEFLREMFPEGVPYDVARQYPKDLVPQLIAELQQPSPGVRLANVVATLGAIGDIRAAAPLIAFVLKGRERLSADEYDAKKGAVYALGLLLNTSDSKEAWEFLKDHLSPTRWTSELRWTLPYDDTGNITVRDWQMVKVTAAALGVSGKPEAAALLSSQPRRFRSSDPSTPADIEDVFRSALQTNAVVRELGLANYLGRDQ